MKVFISAIAGIALLLVGVSCRPEAEMNQSDKSSVTIGAEDITAISVVLKGKANLKSSASSDLRVGFQYSKSAGILPSNSTSVDAEDADADYLYSASISGLEPGTTYYFRSFISQNGQDEFGETQKFETKPLSEMIQTMEASNISLFGATLNATLDLTGIHSDNVRFGFCWGTEQDALYDWGGAIENNRVISLDVSRLEPSKQYYFQAYLYIDSYEYKGDILSFFTNDLSSLLSTDPASGITAIGARLDASFNTAEIDNPGVYTSFYWGTRPDRLYYEIEAVKDSNKHSAYLKGLSPSTQYYFRAHIYINGREYDGDILSFTTKDISSLLETKDASSVLPKIATMNASLDLTDISYNNISYGFSWGYSENYLPYSKVSDTVTDNQFSATMGNLPQMTQFWYKAYVVIDDTWYYGSVKGFTTTSFPEVVDLGLSVKWRSWNLGASSPEEYGHYYAWGETETKTNYSFDTYKWFFYGFTRYCPSENADWWSAEGDPDNKTEFKDYDYVDDAARVNLGGKWRTPSVDEIFDLYYECTWLWTDDYMGTGVSGMTVTSNKSGYEDKSIFLPAAGYLSANQKYELGVIGNYWSASLDTTIEQPRRGFIIIFDSDGYYEQYSVASRNNGLTIRPVIE